MFVGCVWCGVEIGGLVVVRMEVVDGGGEARGGKYRLARLSDERIGAAVV